MSSISDVKDEKRLEVDEDHTTDDNKGEPESKVPDTDESFYISKAEWVRVCSKSELKEGFPFLYEAPNTIDDEDTRIAVVKWKENIYAIDDICPHQGGSLALGDIEELPSPCPASQSSQDDEPPTASSNQNKTPRPLIVCPLHGWNFYLDTGEGETIPFIKQKTYKVKLQDEDVMVEVTQKEEVDF